MTNTSHTAASASTLPFPVPAFDDNYLWLLSRQGNALIVDPGDANKVNQHLQQQQLTLVAILLTHHHPDHIGGVDQLRKDWPDVRVYGPEDQRMPGQIEVVKDGDKVDIESMGLSFEVLETPGHTLSHIAYYGKDDSNRLLFCGDTLFSVGCGRLFEGTAAQMQASLDRFAALPHDTLVFPAHEYTQSNCRFALAVEPENQDLQAFNDEVAAKREAGQPTLPTSIAHELKCNPFMRTREANVIAAAQSREPNCGDDANAVMAVIRGWKDQF